MKKEGMDLKRIRSVCEDLKEIKRRKWFDYKLKKQSLKAYLWHFNEILESNWTCNDEKLKTTTRKEHSATVF